MKRYYRQMSKNILWLSDFNRNSFPGGSQYSTWHILEYGRNLGYDIEFVTKDNINTWIGNKSYLNKYDVVFTGTFILLQHTKNLIEWLKTQNHIRRESDITLYLSEETRLNLFSSTKKAVFLCDEHYDYYKTNHFQDISINYEIVFPYVGKQFLNLNKQREKATLWAGHLNYNKGIERFAKMVVDRPDDQFVVAYNTYDGEIIKWFEQRRNVKIIFGTKREDMPKIYNKYTDFFMMPLQQEGFCLSVSEALLSGMNVITNDLVPAKKNYDRLGSQKFREECKNGPKKFWEYCV